MKQNKSKQKPSITEQTGVFQTQALIIIEHEFFYICEPLKLFFIVIGQLQVVSYLVTPHRSIQYLRSAMSNQISSYMNLIPLVTRPHTFITQAGVLGEDGGFRQYCFLIIFTWIILLLITLALMQLYFRKTVNKFKHLTLSEKIKQLPSIILILIYFLAWTLQMMNIILFVPAMELCFEAFAYSRDIIVSSSIQNQTMNYTMAFLSLFTIIILFIIKIVRYLISEETITLSMRGNEKLNLTMIEIFTFFLKSGQVFIYIFVQDYSIALYLQLLCAACITILTVSDIIIFYSLCDRVITNCILITQSFNSSMIIIYLIINVSQLEQKGFTAIIILLNFGFFASLILRYRDESELRSFQIKKVKVVDDSAQLQYKITECLLYYQQHCRSTRGILLQIIIVLRHRQLCEDVDCFCKIIRNQVDNPRQVLFTNDQILQEYIIILLKRMNKCNKKIKNDYEKFSFTLHYIAALSLIGMNTQAFQQTNIVIQKQVKSHSKAVAETKNESELYSSASKSITQSDKFRQNLNLKNINEKQRKQTKAIQVSNIERINFIQRQKIVILQSQIKQKINQNVTNNESKKGNADEITYAVNLFLDSEDGNLKLKVKVLELMSMKLAFYDLLTSSKNVDGGIIFNESQRISYKLYSTEQNLTKLYQQFPSQKIQSVICFFQAEIANNYLLAYKIASVTKIADEKLMKMHRNLSINLFTSKITYLILGLEQQNFNILDGSNSAHEFFQYSQEEFKKFPNVNFLMPPAIKREHNIVVNEFLRTGKSKFFRNQSLNFCTRKDQYIIPVDFLYDINFSNLGNFSFAAFFEFITYTSAYILVDMNGFVGGVTRNLFEKMGFKNSEIRLLDVQHIMYYTHITKIFPNFEELVDEIAQHDHITLNSNYIHSLKHQDIQTLFLRNEVVRNYFVSLDNTNSSHIITQHNAGVASSNKIWGTQSNLQQYQSSCVININAIVGMRYYIIEVEELKQVKNDVRAFLTPNYTTVTDSQMKPFDDISLKSPLDHKDEKIKSAVFQNEIDWSMLIEPIDISVEKEINSPQAMYVVHNDKDIDFNKDEIKQYNRKEFNYELASPENSMRPLVIIQNDSLNTPSLSQDQVKINHNFAKSKKKQQRFFFAAQSKSFDNSSKAGQSMNNDKFDQLKLYDVQGIDEEVKQNVLQMLQQDKINNQNKVKIDDNGSQVSSVNGIRKSPFYKKYEILSKVVNSKNNPTQLIAMNAFMALKMFLVFIFSLIFCVYVQTDLQKFLQEIDILQVTNYFIAPELQFTVERLGIYRYDHQWAAGNISNQTHSQLDAFLLTQVLTDYDTMKKNYVLQFSNVYLQEFFTDQYIVVMQGVNASNITSSFNVTLRTALELLLETVFIFEESYIGITSRPQLYLGPGLFYQYKNIMPLIQKFEGLSQQILKSTTKNTVVTSNKWNNTWLPFFIIIIILNLMAWICYKMYLRKLEQIMTMFRYVTTQSIEKDKERYKVLLNYLNKDSNLIFKYQFNLDQKEKILYLVKSKSGTNQHQNKNVQTKGVQINNSLQNLKLPILKSVIVFSLVLSIFVVFSTIINIETQTYLQKYSATATLFKQFSDIGFYLPCLFFCRETLYNWLALFNVFMLESDKQQYIQQINSSYQKIGEFITLLNFFKPELYLCSDEFSHQFQAVKTESLCNFLDTNLTNSSQYYCQNSFQGVLDRGLAITLDTFLAHFVNEQQINNFSVRSDSSLLQVEGEFITQKVTEYLKTQLKTGLVDLTQNHIDKIKVNFNFYLKNLCIVLITFAFFGSIYIFTIVSSYLRHEFTILKRLILLMPSTSLFFDDQFERQVRLILVKENIV